MEQLSTHPWLSGLFEDPQTSEMLGTEAQLRHMLSVEAAYSEALAAVGSVPAEVADTAAKLIRQHRPDMQALRDGTALDGVVVPALVRSLKAALPDHCHVALHKGMTSQDIVDTALVLSIKDILELFSARLSDLTDALVALEQAHGECVMMGRTRMQAALQITVATRLQNWRLPLADHQKRLTELQPRLLVLQLGGAVGDRAGMHGSGQAIADHMAHRLGLISCDANWHTRRDNLAEFASWLSLITGALGKIGQDVSLMAQQGVDEVSLTGGGGSSAMPHKRNPVRAELLVALASFNAIQLSGMHQALVHEQERSGAAWTLEWMILPQMILATGQALISCHTLLQQIDRIGPVE